ncbi:MAG: hypothetical protein ACOCQ4_02805, partial [bacterium]
DVDCKQYYCLVGNEGHRLEKVFNDLNQFHGECILPPYPREMGTYIPEVLRDNSYELNEVSFTDKYKDAHTSLAIQTAISLKTKNLKLIGYDGYDKDFISVKEKNLIYENEYIFNKAKQFVNLKTITPSQYSLEIVSVYSLI